MGYQMNEHFKRCRWFGSFGCLAADVISQECLRHLSGIREKKKLSDPLGLEELWVVVPGPFRMFVHLAFVVSMM